MKKILSVFLLLVSAAVITAEIPIGFFGGNNFGLITTTTFAADFNDGSTGLETAYDLDLWLEFTPYADRNLTAVKDTLSVALKMSNSAFYTWMGYKGDVAAGMEEPSFPSYNPPKVYFNTFTADLQYNDYFFRIAGVEPEITISQASIKTVFDNVISNRTASDKNGMKLPLFSTGRTPNENPDTKVGYSNVWYNGAGGVVSVIGRDLLYLNRREVEVYGNYTLGYTSQDFTAAVKAGSWKNGEDNDDNSWVFGTDIFWKIDMVSSLTCNVLGAVNYGTVTTHKNDVESDVIVDPQASSTKLKETPLAVSLGYQYKIDLPKRMVLRPYAGADIIYNFETEDLQYEIGGGLQWFFRGVSAQFKRNTLIGGARLGDVNNMAGFIIGANYDDNGVMNMIISCNEDPAASPIKNLGGFFQFELMNILSADYTAPDNTAYNSFLWAGILQLEYKVTKQIMPYIYGMYVPGDRDSDTSPVYSSDTHYITSKIGVRLTPFDHFSLDTYYKRTDKCINDEWTLDAGALFMAFQINL